MAEITECNPLLPKKSYVLNLLRAGSAGDVANRYGIMKQSLFPFQKVMQTVAAPKISLCGATFGHVELLSKAILCAALMKQREQRSCSEV